MCSITLVIANCLYVKVACARQHFPSLVVTPTEVRLAKIRCLIYLGEPTSEELEGLPLIERVTSNQDIIIRLSQWSKNKRRFVERVIDSLLSRRYLS